MKMFSAMKLLLVQIVVGFVVAMSSRGCTEGVVPAAGDYRQSMRNFVQSISRYAKTVKPNFIIIPQNGHDLLISDNHPATQYINAIDGLGREDLFFGYAGDDLATPSQETSQMITFMDIAEANGVEVVVTDYCQTQANVDASYKNSNAKHYISFAADHRELDDIPAYPAEPYNVNTSSITSLAQAKNFLYLINPDAFGSKQSFLSAMKNTNYDLLIIDLFFNGTPLTANEVKSLKTKSNGGTRLVVAYMSIGEAEDYRYYWKDDWKTNPPAWLMKGNPNWQGNYKVKYWFSDWQKIITGNSISYLQKILDAGFDGAYLDIIDAYEYFEEE